MPIAFDQFVKQLEESGVVSSGKLAAFLPPNAHPKDAQELARELVKSNHLTKYQAQEVYAGRARSLILGNYTLVDKIGAGGMGQVFKAEHRRMKRVVALKMLPASVTKDPAAVARFQREVEAAARLRHTNIVAADDADEANGVHFLVMEYVNGSDLSALVKKNGPLPVAQAVECIRQASLGLAYAHKRGVIHRDIKPANLLVDSEGTVKILDMGLARLEGQLHDAASVAGLTQSGQVMGTVDYMSPEQAEETRGVDHRADQYSLGCTLWVLLTGRPMFGGTTTIAKLMAHRTAPIPALRAARADAPEALEAVYRKMVAKEPDQRYASMDEVIAALASCLGDAPSSALDGPSSSDSRLTEFFKQIAGTKMAAPAKSVTAVDGETQQLQPARQDTGTEHKIASPARGEATQALAPHAKAPPTKPVARLSVVAPSAIVAEKPAEELVGKTQPAKLRRVHPLALVAGIAIAGIGSMGLLLALVVMFVLPRLRPVVNDVPRDSQPSKDTPGVVAGNYALEFDGRTSYVELECESLDLSGPLTVEVVVRFHDSSKRESIFAARRQNEWIGIWRDNKFAGASRWFNDTLLDNTHSDPGGNASVELLGVHHVAEVWDGNRLVIYVDGKRMGGSFQDSRSAVFGELVTASVPKLRAIIGGTPIAANDGIANCFTGIVEELRISQCARYPDEFTPPQRLESDRETFALYHFDEGQGDVLRDSSGNNHHGKIVGAKWVKVGDNVGDR